MKVDTFTKVVLTIIAVNLTIITVKNIDIIPKAFAGEPSESSALSPGTNYGLVPVNTDGSINVKLSSYDELDVNIVGIETTDDLDANIVGIRTSDELDANIVGIETSDELDVNLDEIGGAYVSYGGPILVDID